MCPKAHGRGEPEGYTRTLNIISQKLPSKPLTLKRATLNAMDDLHRGFLLQTVPPTTYYLYRYVI